MNCNPELSLMLVLVGDYVMMARQYLPDFIYFHSMLFHFLLLSYFQANYRVIMGNNSSKNDDFSKNQNFNLQQHKQSMNHLSSNYSNVISVNGYPNNSAQIKVQQTQFKAVHRTCSVYKPTIKISIENDSLLVEFQYDSDNGSKFHIFIGVRKVDQNERRQTVRIDSQLFYQQFLIAGKKVKFSKRFPFNGFSQIKGVNVIFKVISTVANEKTEYSIKNVGPSTWKVLLQKLQYNGLVTQLDNIYRGGDDNDDCIICFSQKVDTFIEPCNHLCLCYECSGQVKRSTNVCPICRANITGFKRIKRANQS